MRLAIIVLNDGQFIGVFYIGKNDPELVCKANGGNQYIWCKISSDLGPVVHSC